MTLLIGIDLRTSSCNASVYETRGIPCRRVGMLRGDPYLELGRPIKLVHDVGNVRSDFPPGLAFGEAEGKADLSGQDKQSSAGENERPLSPLPGLFPGSLTRGFLDATIVYVYTI
jgi:hypothetical protein